MTNGAVATSGARDRNPYRRLRREMFLVLLSFGLLPLVAMGIAGYLAHRAALQTRARGVLEAMVKNRKTTVELFLNDTLRQLELIAGALPVAELSRPQVLDAVLERAHRERGAIVDLGLIGDDGRHRAYAGPYKLEGLDYSGEGWFQQVMVRGSYESDIFLGFRHFPHMVMAVKKREAGRAWILRATIDTDLLSALVREGGLESGADVFILNRAGEYQTRYSDEHRLMERADCPVLPRHSGVRVVEHRRAGQRELLASAWLPGESWVLVARHPLPGPSVLGGAHPAVTGVLLAGLLLVPVLSHLIARYRLRQFRGLEAERAALFESVAQSQKMAAIGRLAAGVAHEINNPLAIIQAQVGVLSDILADRPDLPLAAEFRDRVAKIEAQVERGRKVTHQLLGFSRRVGPEREPVDVAAALEETVGFLEKQLESPSPRIARDYRSEVPIIRSSLSRMQQVFLNLLNNALDAVGQRGEVRLSVEAVDGGVRVTVADDGPGIPENEIPHIFEPFYSTKAGSLGHAGMGLAICQEIMKQLGGSIGVESVVDRGTTFTLWFPAEAESL
ncbi:MAG TPA: ATP-binding protein [Vicinamibacteria bacterium]|nr:ATP-binding protein [Vicinamibacteria bacterium]